MQINLNNIVKCYETASASVLDSISLEIKTGSSVAIVGPSGSGKSTLLNLIGTLDVPTSGEVLIDGMSTMSFSKKTLAFTRNRRIGFVFQTHLLLPQLTAIENIILPALPLEKSLRNQKAERAKELLNSVGLLNKINNYPGEMSVGECQRIAVARAMINEPELLLADEPTGSLDHDTAENLVTLVLEMKHKYPFTLVMVTHSLELAERMDTVYELINGKIRNRAL